MSVSSFVLKDKTADLVVKYTVFIKSVSHKQVKLFESVRAPTSFIEIKALLCHLRKYYYSYNHSSVYLLHFYHMHVISNSLFYKTFEVRRISKNFSISLEAFRMTRFKSVGR